MATSRQARSRIFCFIIYKDLKTMEFSTRNGGLDREAFAERQALRGDRANNESVDGEKDPTGDYEQPKHVGGQTALS
jgi:hypothetical protein